jgi:23S rRNA pseudouridine1911/1915/1917 synthase
MSLTLEILFEDDALIFINKPAGVVVQQRMHHPDERHLHAEVTRHTFPAYLMQRLDRGTSGVMFFSKRGDLNRRLTRQFERKQIRKWYLAVCEGHLGERQTVDAPLARVGAIKFAVREGGKTAITHIRPLHATPRGSLLEIGLETGRTHQIRAHLSAIGHPLAGDWLYGAGNAVRPMLHAAEIELTHPSTNEPLRVAAPLPDDFLEEANRRGIVTGGRHERRA